MKTGARVVWPSKIAEMLPGAALFAATLALAWWGGWTTTDLLWSTWFTGVVVGYAALLVGLAGEWRRKRDVPLAGWVAAAAALFYTAHFLGFNWLVATLLPILAPVEGLRGGFWSARFWTVLVTHYWPMLLMTVVAERAMLGGAWQRFDQISPYLPVVRAWVIYLPLFWVVLLGDMTKLFTVDHLACYTLVALAYFSPWRIEAGPETDRS